MTNEAVPSRNTLLEARMRAAGMTATNLAEALNSHLLTLTARSGVLTDRSVRRFLSGQTRWPQTRQRLALEALFECSIEELGFVPPHGSRSTEAPVHRRSFLSASTGAAAAFTVPGRRRIGHSDVRALRADLNALVSRHIRVGGNTELETAALTQAQLATDLVRHGEATETVTRAVYSVAASATASAAWAAIDSGQLDRGQRHLDRSLSLAGLSADSEAMARAWNMTSLLAHAKGAFAEGSAAADALRALPAARKDPLYASLGYVRSALGMAVRKDASGALRSLRRAETALGRSMLRERPPWVYFYDEAELHGLAAVIFVRLGRPAEAESFAHHALTHLKPDLVRVRGYYTAVLGLAQLRQGELELACATVDPLVTHGLPGSDRVRGMLHTFRTEASAIGSAQARQWLDNAQPWQI